MAGSRRNYKAMLDHKLMQCIAELDREQGDAYRRCVSKGGDPQVDLAIAAGEARDRGLNVTTSGRPTPAPVAPAPQESYDELIERVKAATNLNARQASVIAASLPDTTATTEQIVRRAEALGYQPT